MAAAGEPFDRLRVSPRSRRAWQLGDVPHLSDCSLDDVLEDRGTDRFLTVDDEREVGAARLHGGHGGLQGASFAMVASGRRNGPPGATPAEPATSGVVVDRTPHPVPVIKGGGDVWSADVDVRLWIRRTGTIRSASLLVASRRPCPRGGAGAR